MTCVLVGKVSSPSEVALRCRPGDARASCESEAVSVADSFARVPVVGPRATGLALRLAVDAEATLGERDVAVSAPDRSEDRLRRRSTCPPAS